MQLMFRQGKFSKMISRGSITVRYLNGDFAKIYCASGVSRLRRGSAFRIVRYECHDVVGDILADSQFVEEVESGEWIPLFGQRSIRKRWISHSCM